MHNIYSIFKREIKGYFTTPLAYVFLVVFLMLTSWMTFWQNDFFPRQHCSLGAFFTSMPLMFILLVPAMAMRLWAEERGNKTIEMLYSLPITTTQAVIGKYLAALTIITLALILTFPMVITVAYLGNPDTGPILAGYTGLFFMSAAYLAIGSFCSVLSKSQVIAFIFGVVVCGLFYLPSSPAVMDFMFAHTPQFMHGVVKYGEMFSTGSRFEALQRGVLDLRDISFFVILAGGWLWMNIILLEERRAT